MMRKFAGALALILAAPYPVAHAVQILGTDGLNHLVAPTDDPGWSNVGTVGGGSFVYLGDYASGYWALSAVHVVGAANGLSLNIGGTSYSSVSNSAVRLTNAGGGLTDLVLFQIAGDGALASLPNLTISSTAVATNDTIRFVGAGYQRAATPTFWSDTGGAWTELASSSGANRAGYKWTGTRAMSWGDNVVSSAGVSVNVGNGPTTAFATTFDNIAGDAMLAVGDSGGAAFRKVGGQWELAGINDAIGTYNNQPASTSVLGDAAYAADLSHYRTQIMNTVAVPEPSAWMASPVVAFLSIAVVRRRKKGVSR